MLEADAVSPQLRTISVGNLVEIDRLGPRAQSIRLIFENNKMSWHPGAGHYEKPQLPPKVIMGRRIAAASKDLLPLSARENILIFFPPL